MTSSMENIGKPINQTTAFSELFCAPIMAPSSSSIAKNKLTSASLSPRAATSMNRRPKEESSSCDPTVRLYICLLTGYEQIGQHVFTKGNHLDTTSSSSLSAFPFLAVAGLTQLPRAAQVQPSRMERYMLSYILLSPSVPHPCILPVNHSNFYLSSSITSLSQGQDG
jgi:hypothetical protein